MENKQHIYSNCQQILTFLIKIAIDWNPSYTRLRLICEWSDIVCVLAPLSLSSSPCSLSSSNNFLTFPECPEDSTVEAESEDDIAASQTSLERPAPHRGNTMVHVCWHRNTSVSMVDFSIAVEVPAKPQHSDLLLPSCLTVFFLCVRVCAVPWFTLITSQWEQYPPLLHHIILTIPFYA